jgi:uncharacterized membrane protein
MQKNFSRLLFVLILLFTFQAIPALAKDNSLIQSQTEPGGQTVWDKFNHDVVGNSIAVIVLLIMVASLLYIGLRFVFDPGVQLRTWPEWVVPTLAVIGLGIALYLTYVEVAQAQAICGPVGDCNSVQKSPYAKVLGVIPVGIFGIAGYIAILGAWLVKRYGPASVRKAATVSIWAMSVFGILFSIYLTFLEPFVIGATCMWCISSAVVMTLLLWASSPPAFAMLQPQDYGEAEEQTA